MPRSLTNPWFKQDQLLEHLRRQITEGSWKPGSRLPTRVELQEQLAASGPTIQRAIDQLVADGFVHTRGRHGTFVAANPPHTDHCVLAFAQRPGDHGWVRFWTALANEAPRAKPAGTRALSVYHGIDGHADSEDYQRLLRDVGARRVAGMIFASPPHRVKDGPLLGSGVPWVFVTSGEFARDWPGSAAILLDHHSFLDRALDHFAARGCKRVAVLGVPGLAATRERIVAGIARRGMTTRPTWFQALHPAPESAAWAKECAQLLLDGDRSRRPDALLITDDNLVEHASAGLVAAGVRVPDDLEVVAHCNFPWPTPSVIAARRLGYDARQVLRAGLELIARQRAGERKHLSITVPALFADEFADQLAEPAPARPATPSTRKKP